MSDPSSLDAPRPPGGPQRTDAPDGPDTPGQPARDLQQESAETSLDQPSQ